MPRVEVPTPRSLNSAICPFRLVVAQNRVPQQLAQDAAALPPACLHAELQAELEEQPGRLRQALEECGAEVSRAAGEAHAAGLEQLQAELRQLRVSGRAPPACCCRRTGLCWAAAPLSLCLGARGRGGNTHAALAQPGVPWGPATLLPGTRNPWALPALL
jgi:hypothetical protein